MNALLRVVGLCTDVQLRSSLLAVGPRTVRVVDGVDLTVERGRTLAVVGESGSGKTTLALSIARLIPIRTGQIWFDDTDLAALSDAELRPFRRAVQIVFQDALGSLDPRLCVRDVICEGLRAFRLITNRGEASDRAAALLRLVGLDPVLASRLPHELSGGQRQRICLARALALEPRLLVLDEPVSALDASVQAQVLELLADLQARLGLALVLITHDLAVARQVAHRVAVMHVGQIVEDGPAERVFAKPRHPYTRALNASVLTIDPNERTLRVGLRGEPPSARSPPAGCRFHPRCPEVFDRCRSESPAMYAIDGGTSRCFLCQREEPR